MAAVVGQLLVLALERAVDLELFLLDERGVQLDLLLNELYLLPV